MSASIAAPSMCRSPGRHRDEDRAEAATTAPEPRSHAADDRQRDAGGQVLLVDAQLAALPASPMPCMAGPRMSTYTSGGSTPAAIAASTTCQLPATSPASIRALQAIGPGGPARRRACSCRASAPPTWRRRPAAARRSLAEVDRIDTPLAVDLARGQHPEPDATIDRHVVDAEAIGGFVERQELGRVRGHQSVTTTASCHGVHGRHEPTDSTEPGTRAPSLIRAGMPGQAGQFAGGRSTWSITWMTPFEAMMSVLTTWAASLR